MEKSTLGAADQVFRRASKDFLSGSCCFCVPPEQVLSICKSGARFPTLRSDILQGCFRPAKHVQPKKLAFCGPRATEAVLLKILEYSENTAFLAGCPGVATGPVSAEPGSHRGL